MITVGMGERHSFETNALSAEDTGRHYLSSREYVTVGFSPLVGQYADIQSKSTRCCCANGPTIYY